MRFLTEQETAKEISRQLADGSSLKAAVAFWGVGAAKKLGIETCTAEIRIVCNLRRGGTNPAEIETLQKIKTVIVKHRDDLHAKVYLFDDAAIIGSSNSSANGLAFQDGDKLSWREANILVRDVSLLNEISAWFDKIFKQAESVKPTDIAIALEAWKTKRSGNKLQKTKRDQTLLDAAKENPNQFEGRKIYINVNMGEMSAKEKKEADAAKIEKFGKNTTSSNVDYWWDWPEAPRSAIIIDFHVDCDRNNSIRYYGIYSTPKDRLQSTLSSGHTLQFCFEQKNVDGMKLGNITAWKQAVKEAMKNDKESLKHEAMPLDEFARKYLAD